MATYSPNMSGPAWVSGVPKRETMTLTPNSDTVPGESWSNIVTTSSTGGERNNVVGELQLVSICGMLTWTFDLEQ